MMRNEGFVYAMVFLFDQHGRLFGREIGVISFGLRFINGFVWWYLLLCPFMWIFAAASFVIIVPFWFLLSLLTGGILVWNKAKVQELYIEAEYVPGRLILARLWPASYRRVSFLPTLKMRGSYS